MVSALRSYLSTQCYLEVRGAFLVQWFGGACVTTPKASVHSPRIYHLLTQPAWKPRNFKCLKKSAAIAASPMLQSAHHNQFYAIFNSARSQKNRQNPWSPPPCSPLGYAQQGARTDSIQVWASSLSLGTWSSGRTCCVPELSFPDTDHVAC